MLLLIVRVLCFSVGFWYFFDIPHTHWKDPSLSEITETVLWHSTFLLYKAFVKSVCVSVFVFGGWLCPLSTDSSFLLTENVQFSYVSLHCTSSRQQIRNRHGRKAGEEDGSSITAELELDLNLEEVTGWSSCPSTLPLVLHLFSHYCCLLKYLLFWSCCGDGLLVVSELTCFVWFPWVLCETWLLLTRWCLA